VTTLNVDANFAPWIGSSGLAQVPGQKPAINVPWCNSTAH